MQVPDLPPREIATILAELAREPDPNKRSSLVLEFGMALSRQHEQVVAAHRALDSDLRAELSRVSTALTDLRTMVSTQHHELVTQVVEDKERVSHKLHQLSNVLMVIEDKLNEQALLMSTLFND